MLKKYIYITTILTNSNILFSAITEEKSFLCQKKKMHYKTH